MTRMNQINDSIFQVQFDNDVVSMDMVRVHGIGTATTPYLRGKWLGSLSRRCSERLEQRKRWHKPAVAFAGLKPAAAGHQPAGLRACSISAKALCR